ncbi:Uncharacterised protein [Mycobacteroides abscessus subsp. abscessus]|nr:Uncharacterised protein [Mycobacteroides abscessus subsp. abscessus]
MALERRDDRIEFAGVQDRAQPLTHPEESGDGRGLDIAADLEHAPGFQRFADAAADEFDGGSAEDVR